MSYDDFGTGDGEFFDFDGDGDLDSFEFTEMMNEQDRECEAIFHGESGIGSDDDADFWDDPELAELGIDSFYEPQYTGSNTIQKKNYSNSNSNKSHNDSQNRERPGTVIARTLCMVVFVIDAIISTLIIIDEKGIPEDSFGLLLFGLFGYIVIFVLLGKLIKHFLKD